MQKQHFEDGLELERDVRGAADFEEHRPHWFSRMVSLLPQNAFAIQTTKGLITGLSQTPRDGKGLP